MSETSAIETAKEFGRRYQENVWYWMDESASE